jgi:hypothetical protein
MPNQIRTVDFLPEIFRTDVNSQFLDASLDVLVKQPDFKRVEGYIGEKYGYGVEPKDHYVVESSVSNNVRNNYQLNPSVVSLKPGTSSVRDLITYPGIISALKLAGADVSRHDRLFSSDTYSWDSFIDLDKIVNYGQYYWMPYGPDAVEINSGTVLLNADYTISDTTAGIRVDDIDALNVTINLVRGGEYEFISDGPFFIQTAPELSMDPYALSKQVLGVANNGGSRVLYTVPTAEELEAYDLPTTQFIDLVDNREFDAINGSNIFDLGGIDGVTGVDGKTLLLYSNTTGLELSANGTFYTVQLGPLGDITLEAAAPITIMEAISVRSGVKYAGSRLYKDGADTVRLIPSFSNKLYYRSGRYANNVGVINLVEADRADILEVEGDIIGAKTYVSANGVKLTNGLKVTFTDNVSPAHYANNTYYVEGVGTAITLWNVADFIAPELNDNILYNPWSANPWSTDHWDADYYVPVKADYITINRGDRSRNAWSRSNRWFHQSVIDETIKQNGIVSKRYNNTPLRAVRPIIEFEADLVLFNHGTSSIGSITVIDTLESDALTNVIGRSTAEHYAVDGHVLNAGDRIVFAADTTLSTRSSVFIVDVVTVNGIEVYNLTVDPALTVLEGSSVTTLTGTTTAGSTYDYSNGTWSLSQRKRTVNQPPLFDLFDSNGTSYSSTDYYPELAFAGTKLFSYTLGTGAVDPVLNFPIKYSSISNVGDINFTVDYGLDAEALDGAVVHQLTAAGFITRNGWLLSANNSSQHQVFQFEVKSKTSEFKINVPIKGDGSASALEIYVGSKLLTKSDYTVADSVITLNVPVSDTVVTILALSDVASLTGYYEYPTNITNNPFNGTISTLDMGDLRNQYNSIFKAVDTLSGPVFGYNNYHDLGKLLSYGSAIIKNSASLVLPGLFLRNKDYDLFDALEYNSQEYSNYKSLLIELAQATDYSVYQTPGDILDDIINKIVGIRSGTASFYWSDMLPSGGAYSTNNYTFRNNITDIVVDLSKFYDFNNANYNGLGVYLNRDVNGVPTTIQMIRGVDYDVSDLNATLTISKQLYDGDTLTVKEYNQTYGSYCPSTPTKLGLYPSFMPEIVLDTTAVTPTWFIRGHDGSYTKLWGTYVDGVLDDFRDIVLLEFEQRVYNNLKVNRDANTIPLRLEDVVSGAFRNADYSWEEIQNIYSTSFLNWIGANRIDYSSQQYLINDERTYNYNQSTGRNDGTKLKQGGWRGLYRYFYDTENPAESPWQMLGFSEKPDFWDGRYGEAPYTSDNTVMWEEISAGYVHGVGIVAKYIRPELLNILPVDSRGVLATPMKSLVGNYSRLSFNRDWNVGDVGPAEASYLRSSSWPFDAMRLLALTKPAKFFNYFADIDRYKLDSATGQYLYDSGLHLDPRKLQLYGNGTAKHSYINWMVDYVAVRGVDGTAVITELLSNSDVRLSYNLGGFSSKDYLNFYIERATPDSSNRGLLIPEENYSVVLYDNVPSSTITYSSMLVQKTKDGYKVWGNSQSKLYFRAVLPKTGRYRKTTVGDTTVDLSTDFYADRLTTIAYGTEFYSVQSLCEFIQNYGRYLETAGVLFENISNGVALNWQRMVEELLYWDSQNWEVNSTLALNPNATTFIVDQDDYIVQPLKIEKNNFILNQQLLPLQSENVSIVRSSNRFTANVLSPGDSVAFTQLNLHNVEHVVVFDNLTAFNDVIWNLNSGLRQTRLVLRGSITNNYAGYIDAAGFILNEDNIVEWNQSTKYTRGSIVTHKNNYYSAVTVVEPSELFDMQQWQLINYDAVKLGLLPNPSTVAYDSLYYYDSYRANLKREADLLGFSLIGYRPRSYLAYSDLSDITQVNLYKSMIGLKGTSQSIDGLKNLTFNQGTLDYDVYENWAILEGNFGAAASTNFVEFALNQPNLNSNPSVITFVDGDNTDVEYSNENIDIADAINYGIPPTTRNFLPSYTGTTNAVGSSLMLPSAGYVHLDDIDFTEYTYDDLKTNADNHKNLVRGNYIWLANTDSTWDVLSPVSVGTTVIKATSSQSGQIMFTFSSPHGLSANDKFVILQFNDAIDGYYTVDNARSLTEVIVSAANTNSVVFNIVTVSGYGVAFKLLSHRVEQPADIASITNTGINTTQLFWSDRSTDKSWSVYRVSESYAAQELPAGVSGTVGAYSATVGHLIGSPATSTVHIYNADVTSSISSGFANFGKIIKVIGNRIFIVSDSAISIYDNRLEPVEDILTPNITDIAGSLDNRWLYISRSELNIVYIYKLMESGLYALASSIVDGAPDIMSYGAAIATTVDGTKLVIGSPYESISLGGTQVERAGRAYVYTRYQQCFESVGQSVFTLADNPDDVDVYVNDVLVPTSSYTLATSTLTFTTAIDVGSVVTVEGSTLILAALLSSETPYAGALYGISVATNRYGAEILVGSPYDLSSNGAIQDTNGEGAVYRYTNSGQRYGVVTLRNPAPVAGDFIFINGFKIEFTPGSLGDYASQINDQSGDNVIAIADAATNSVMITTRNRSSDTVNDIVDVVGNIERCARLGITLYAPSQTIRSPQPQDNTAFGVSISMNDSDSLVIGANNSTDIDELTFDGNASSHNDFTIFDHGATLFVDGFERSGAAYVYDYVPAFNAGETNHGQYAYGQNLRPLGDRSTLRNYGSRVAHSGASLFVSDSSGITVLNLAAGSTSSWSVHRTALPAVDINQLHGISIYDTDDGSTLSSLDYIDSYQGKLLGIITENLDHATDVDPAGYYGDNSGNNVNTAVGSIWLADYVGRTWLDTTTVRMLNTHQTDLQYNSTNWSSAHPRSTATIYTWIESLTPPLNHSGDGFPYSYTKYNTAIRYDAAINNTVTVYYYWVRGISFAPAGKRISPEAMSSYILNPRNSGIPFLAPLTTNTIALYNTGSSIREAGSAIHIGYGGNENTDTLHTVWRLIRSGTADDFLPGLPDVSKGTAPSRLYLKLLDSLVGSDSVGLPVPDQSLPQLVQFGTKFRPRQTMLTDRVEALTNLVNYANNILLDLPVTEIRDLSDLALPTNAGLVSRVNYWTAGYSDASKPRLEVATYSDLLRITNNQLESGTESNLFLEEGVLVRVTNNNLGQSETYLYSNADWVRVGLSRGTVRLSTELSTAQPAQVRAVLRWLFETFYADELAIHRNVTLMLLFKLAQASAPQGANYMPWLTKTSLINVNQTVRDLLPFSKLRRDNTELLSGYINEVKPYHVYVADTVFSYSASDEVVLDVTDFDLPAQYNSSTGRFESPRLVYQPSYDPVDALPTDALWSNREYTQWFTNHGLSCDVATTGSTVVARLAADVAQGDTTLAVSATESLAESGTITVDDELMTYSGVDRLRNRITGVYRGVDGRGATTHNSGAAITAVFTPVLVTDTGRDYPLEPRIIVEYDGDGVPRREMKLHAVISLGTVVGVRVEDEGDGYPSQPRIHIEPSVSVDFAGANTDNTITVEDHTLRSGDAVRYRGRDDASMINGEYYYVRVIDSDNFVLYLRYDDAMDVRKLNSVDSRVAASRSGGTLGVSARAIINVSAAPVRNFKTTLLFDRVTYRAGLTQTNDNAIDRIATYYKPTVNMPDTLPQLMSGLTYPNAVIEGAEFSLGAGWDQYNWSQVPWDVAGDILPLLDSIIEAPPFVTDSGYPGTSEHYDVAGGAFADGYAPEELVAGIVTDRLELSIETREDPDDPLDPSFRLSVDRAGVARIYNTNPVNRTATATAWFGDDEIELNDITRIVSIVNRTGLDTNQFNRVHLTDLDTARITNIEVVDEFGTPVPFDWVNGAVGTRTGAGEVWLQFPRPATGLSITLYIGNLIYLNGEYIGFNRVDPSNNTISGLRRGALHTYTAAVSTENPVLADTVVYGVRAANQLPNEFYNQWWTQGYTAGFESAPNEDQFDENRWEYSYYDDSRLSTNTHPAAVFLQNNA